MVFRWQHFKKSDIFEKTTLLLCQFKKSNMVLRQQLLVFNSVSLLASSNLFKFLLYLFYKKKLQLFLSWQISCFSVNFFCGYSNSIRIRIPKPDPVPGGKNLMRIRIPKTVFRKYYILDTLWDYLPIHIFSKFVLFTGICCPTMYYTEIFCPDTFCQDVLSHQVPILSVCRTFWNRYKLQLVRCFCGYTVHRTINFVRYMFFSIHLLPIHFVDVPGLEASFKRQSEAQCPVTPDWALENFFLGLIKCHRLHFLMQQLNLNKPWCPGPSSSLLTWTT